MHLIVHLINQMFVDRIQMQMQMFKVHIQMQMQMHKQNWRNLNAHSNDQHSNAFAFVNKPNIHPVLF